MLAKALTFAVAVGVLRGPGCDTDTSAGGVDAPCTRVTDCSPGLQCTGGVCVDPDAALPPPTDAGQDAAVDASDE